MSISSIFKMLERVDHWGVLVNHHWKRKCACFMKHGGSVGKARLSIRRLSVQFPIGDVCGWMWWAMLKALGMLKQWQWAIEVKSIHPQQHGPTLASRGLQMGWDWPIKLVHLPNPRRLRESDWNTWHTDWQTEHVHGGFMPGVSAEQLACFKSWQCDQSCQRLV